MKPKYTPGPWKVEPIDRNGRYKIETELHSTDEALANARLIAAAPEMYRLLHAIWAKTDPSKDPKTCRAIVNLLGRIDETTKARGES